MIKDLKEAISHARETASKLRKMTSITNGKPYEECLECASEHEQLASWLEELDERREADAWNVIHTEADLPKESDWYLVTRVYNSGKYVEIAFFNDNTKFFYEDSCTPLNNIIAWKPMPKPYESEEK